MPEYRWTATVTEAGSGRSRSEDGTITASSEREAENSVRRFLNSKRTAKQDVTVNVYPRG